MIAWLHSDSNYIQKNATDVYILSTKNENHPTGFFIYDKSIRRAVTLYCARSIIKSTWLSNADVYLEPIVEINT